MKRRDFIAASLAWPLLIEDERGPRAIRIR